MRPDRQKALKLRLKGKSYNEITRLLGIPKSTLSGWFTKLELSEKAKKRIRGRVHEASLRGLIRRNKNQTHLAIQRMRQMRSTAKSEVSQPGLAELKLLGAMLYWAEGYKRPIYRNGQELTYHSVALANSDPNLIRIFLRFLREVCQVPDEKIDADIRIYKHMNEQSLMKFWQRVTGLPTENFGKVYYGISKSSLGKRPFNILPYGTISIRVNSTPLFHKIMGWIEGLTENTNYS